MKPVLILLIIFFAVRFLRKYLSAKSVPGDQKAGSRTVEEGVKRGPRGEGEEMVLDPVCKSYIPISSAISQGGEYFCGPECRDRFTSTSDN